MASPAFYAWQALGSPRPIENYSKYIILGQCSHCGEEDTETILVKRVASNRFTSWDSYSNDDKPKWCNVCIWSFSEQTNRTEVLYIKKDILYRGYQVQSMKTLLKNPINETTCLSLALKKNKHVLPYAQWGTIRIEDISFQWGSREIAWLIAVERLVSLGFLIGDIKKDNSPSFSVVINLQKEETVEAYTLWENLAPLRYFPQLFSFILELNKKATMEYLTFSSHNI